MPKPPSSLLREFRVRVDGSDDDLALSFCKKYCESYLLVHHVTLTENPHFHFYALTRYSQGNFSNHIKAHFNVKGGDYSNKTSDPDRKLEYCSYLFNTKKGNVPRLLSYEGFNPIEIEIYRSNAKQIADEFQTRMASKMTQYEMCQVVLNRLTSDKIVSPSTVYDAVIEVLRESHTMARPNHVKDMIATVMAYSDNKQAKLVVKDLTLKFFSCN